MKMMDRSVLALLSLLVVLSLQSQTCTAQPPLPPGVVIRIDCGGFANYTNQFNETWMEDMFFTGGAAGFVSNPESFAQIEDRTIRYFPTTGGKKHCYLVPVPNGRYFVRMFFVYGNYDNKTQTPTFDVSVGGTVVLNWQNPWSPVVASRGAYADLQAFVQDEQVSVCFYSIATDFPLIGALEIVQIDPLSYDSAATGQDVILVNYGRITGGNISFGAGLTNNSDVGGRAWQVDNSFSDTPKQVLQTLEPIRDTDVAPNYFPEQLYQSSRTLQPQPSLPPITYNFTVDSSSDYMIWLHFAEIDPGVSSPGQRVFDISINDQVVFTKVDIFASVGNFAAFDLNYTVKNLTATSLSIQFIASAGVPIVSGVEILAILPTDISTDLKEVAAMQDLKKTLQIPDRMGWNGDPCAPSSWDAWDGVSCTQNNEGNALVISRLDLSVQGLTGTISDKITALSYLLYLNLSSNDIGGNIPAGLGQGTLQNVDLSDNSLTGSIPDSLGSAQLTRVLVNENLLSGQVPEALYSIGVRGGFINLSFNEGLCGIPSLPACPHFWQKSGMSGAAKVGVVFGCLAAAAVLSVLVFLCIKRRNMKDDYNFGLPHQLAMRHKRYMQYRAALQSNDDGHMMRVSPSKYGFSTTMNSL